MILLGKTAIFVCLTAGAWSLFFLAGRERAIKEAMLRALSPLNQASRERRRGARAGRGYLQRLEERLTYSGLTKGQPFLTAELFLCAMMAAAGAGFLLLLSLSGSLSLAMAAMISILFAVHGALGYLCHRNYKRTEEELLVFLNLLDSCSITASEITGIFYKVSRYLGEPLRSALEGCFFEAQTTGDTSLSLKHLADRIEHPKAREIIRDLEVCSRYDADYASVVKNCRRGVQDHLAYRKKRKSLAAGARIEMLFLVLAGALSLTLMGTLLQEGIWELLFGTTAGRCLLGFLGGVLALFYSQVVLFDRD